jgi:hypothetical protein
VLSAARQTELVRDEPGGHRLPGSWRPREQSGDAKALANLRAKTPGLVDGAALAHAHDQLDQRVVLLGWQDQVFPRLRDPHTVSEACQSCIDDLVDRLAEQLGAGDHGPARVQHAADRMDHGRRERVERRDDQRLGGLDARNRTRPQRCPLRRRERPQLEHHDRAARAQACWAAPRSCEHRHLGPHDDLLEERGPRFGAVACEHIIDVAYEHGSVEHESLAHEDVELCAELVGVLG